MLITPSQGFETACLYTCMQLKLRHDWFIQPDTKQKWFVSQKVQSLELSTEEDHL